MVSAERSGSTHFRAVWYAWLLTTKKAAEPENRKQRLSADAAKAVTRIRPARASLPPFPSSDEIRNIYRPIGLAFRGHQPWPAELNVMSPPSRNTLSYSALYQHIPSVSYDVDNEMGVGPTFEKKETRGNAFSTTDIYRSDNTIDQTMTERSR